MKRTNKLSKLHLLGSMVLSIALAGPAAATTVSTEFNTSDGFVTGDTGAVTLASGGFEVSFSGGQQQQMFDGPSYNNGPAAYLFVNGGPGFTGTSGGVAASTGDLGLIDFNIGVTEVSFHAANRGTGAGTTVRVLGVDDVTVLDTFLVTETVQSAASFVSFNAAGLGGLIGSIEIDLPGPAANPTYAASIDTFSATPVPEPTSALLFSVGLAWVASRRPANHA